MRLGGRIFKEHRTPDEWARAVRASGYTADRDCLPLDASDELIVEYREAACRHDVVIAEIGAWGANPLHPDAAERARGVRTVMTRLEQAEKVGARCCVNIAGSNVLRENNGPVADHLTADVFELIVDSVRAIIDAVRPVNTYYCLETMPWMFPHSADSYARLVQAVDRERFGVHMDPVNIITSPERYYDTGAVIREFCAMLGPRIRSCHAKDIVLRDSLTVHLDETCPGRGNLAYGTYLREISRLDADMPLMIEHLQSADEYAEAAAYIRCVADDEGIELHEGAGTE